MTIDSTRKLYEKKLEKAMENAPVKASSDKTYYREEGRMLLCLPVICESINALYVCGSVVKYNSSAVVQAVK